MLQEIMNNKVVDDKKIYEINKYLEDKNLYLSKSDIKEIISNRLEILSTLKRFEVSDILEDLIVSISTSSFVDKYNIKETILELTRIFYLYQVEFEYKLSDEFITQYIVNSYEECGVFELLETTYLDNLKEYYEYR